jgi:hypothetical protein
MKGAKKTLIPLVIAIAVFMTVGFTLAKQPAVWENYAYGTIDTYTAAYSAEMVNGYWNLKITDGKIHFNYGWLELNLDEDIENSPAGSVDELSFTNIGPPMYYEYDEGENVLYMFLQIQVNKEWAMFDGSYSHKTWKSWQFVIIDFDAGTILIDAYPPEGEEPPVIPSDPDTWDWDKEGTVLGGDY